MATKRYRLKRPQNHPNGEFTTSVLVDEGSIAEGNRHTAMPHAHKRESERRMRQAHSQSV